MKRLCLLILLSVFYCPPTVSEVREFSAGEVVRLEITLGEPADVINIYRKTGVTTKPSLVGTITVRPAVWVYSASYTMPGGTTPEYRFWVVPKKGTELLDESNGVRVKRKQ